MIETIFIGNSVCLFVFFFFFSFYSSASSCFSEAKIMMNCPPQLTLKTVLFLVLTWKGAVSSSSSPVARCPVRLLPQVYNLPSLVTAQLY